MPKLSQKKNSRPKRNLKKSSTKRTNVRKNKKSLKKRGGAPHCNQEIYCMNLKGPALSDCKEECRQNNIKRSQQKEWQRD